MKDVPRKNPRVKWKKTGASGVLLDLQTGDYFELDETALAIWKLIDGKTPGKDIAKKLAAKYPHAAKSVEKDVLRFLDDLQKRSLVETTPR